MKEIPLTRGAVAIVDNDDFEYLNQFRWYLNSEGYAVRDKRSGGKRTRIRMHREIIKTPDGMDTDHINNNRLDNRKENLRTCSRAENICNSLIRKDNTSGYKGVSYFKPAKKWKMQITMNGKSICKYFDNPKDAAIAYNDAATKYFGKFANLNKIT